MLAGLAAPPLATTIAVVLAAVAVIIVGRRLLQMPAPAAADKVPAAAPESGAEGDLAEESAQ
jgi:hypothetical protein